MLARVRLFKRRTRKEDLLRGHLERLGVSPAWLPSARDAIRYCEEGSSAGIMTYRLDRFSRSTLDTLAAVKRLRDCGARLVTVDDRVDHEAKRRVKIGPDTRALVQQIELDKAVGRLAEEFVV